MTFKRTGDPCVQGKVFSKPSRNGDAYDISSTRNVYFVWTSVRQISISTWYFMSAVIDSASVLEPHFTWKHKGDICLSFWSVNIFMSNVLHQLNHCQMYVYAKVLWIMILNIYYSLIYLWILPFVIMYIYSLKNKSIMSNTCKCVIWLEHQPEYLHIVTVLVNMFI